MQKALELEAARGFADLRRPAGALSQLLSRSSTSWPQGCFQLQPCWLPLARPGRRNSADLRQAGAQRPGRNLVRRCASGAHGLRR